LKAIAYRPTDAIAPFCNPPCKHIRNGMLSPIAREQRQKLKPSGVLETQGYPHAGRSLPQGGLKKRQDRIDAEKRFAQKLKPYDQKRQGDDFVKGRLADHANRLFADINP
jgi:hypothetical protein